MASKSKRRGRVFRASCILAALIIAGSSFAWFTSTDETTNRLTASADYGVSIVESFAPPRNWLPGQNINKDTYAVNTGNIDAFVKNDVSGVLNYTYETLVNAPDTTNGVKLNELADTDIDGATTMEAGSILAWTDTDESLGNKASVRAEDEDVFGNRWTPTKTGVYIFRRSIDYDNNTGKNNYTYAGYYYDNGNYYKIVLGDDPYPAYDEGPDFNTTTASPTSVSGLGTSFDVASSSLGSGITVDSEGIVTSGTPTIRYAVEGEIKDWDVTLTLDKTTDPNKPKLVATYAANTSVAGANSYDASATAARAEIDYLNAKDVSDKKTARFDQIKADYNYAKALQEARDALTAAAETRGKINDAATAATTNNTKALNYVNNEGKSLYDNYFYGKVNQTDAATMPTAISVNTIVPNTGSGDVQTHITQADTPKSYANLQELITLESDVNSLVSSIKTQLETLKNNTSTATQVAAAVQQLKSDVAALKNKLQQYKEKFANLKASTAQENVATGLDTDDTAKTAIQSVIDYVTALETQVDKTDGIAKKSVDYTKAAAEYTTNVTNVDIGAANTAWTSAKSAYTSAVSSAKSSYESAIAAISVDSDNTIKGQNHSTDIVKYNSARREDGATDPAFNGSYSFGNAGDTYANDYDYYRLLVPGGTANIPGTTTSTDIKGSDYLDKTTFSESGLSFDSSAAWNLGDGTAKTYDYLEKAAAEADAEETAKEKVKDEANRVLPNGGKVVKINIYLNPEYKNYWEMDSNTNGTTNVDFYLKHILDAGATSEKLIDSVEMDKSVETGTYKELTFDLNVGLDSAQVTYDANDQTKVTADSVTNPDPFGMKATVADDNKTVSWTAL